MKEEKLLLLLLKKSLESKEKALPEEDVSEGNWENREVDWERLLQIADKHAVLPLLYDVLQEIEIPEHIQEQLEVKSRRTVVQSYRLLFLTKYVISRLKEQGIPAIVLKGVSTAASYPVPELRKSGDIDLLIGEEADLEILKQVMEQEGFYLSGQQHANHHIVYSTPDGIDIELHRLVVEPFENRKVNEAVKEQMAEILRHCKTDNVMGVALPVLERPYQAYYLLLHMLQHFVYAGFGLKLLCDWVVLLNQEWQETEKSLFWGMVQESIICGFARTVTEVCVQYLGLSESKVTFMQLGDIKSDIFIAEIFDAEEFGYSGRDRMVLMRGSRPADYLREFHHQMKLNFPKQQKYVILWPVLWIITLVTFLYNNRKIRKVSLAAVLRTAGSRSRRMEELKLFDE